jgi:hypothetical protein
MSATTIPIMSSCASMVMTRDPTATQSPGLERIGRDTARTNPTRGRGVRHARLGPDMREALVNRSEGQLR